MTYLLYFLSDSLDEHFTNDQVISINILKDIINIIKEDENEDNSLLSITDRSIKRLSNEIRILKLLK